MILHECYSIAVIIDPTRVMEEKKLNFNAPLLSVRRYSMASSSSSVEEDKKKTENSIFRSETEFSFDQVTEPVAIPFHWEFIPGRSKNNNDEPESKLSPQPERTPITPRLLQNLTGDDEREISIGNERENKDFEIDDGCSDAMETRSSSDSLSLYSCSVSGLSGSDGPDMKPCGTFSIDPQTLDFMMKRFLPSAKAMAIDTGNYASRKQITAVEQPEKPRSQNVKSSIQEIESIMTTQDKEIEEKEERDVGRDECKDSSNVLTKNCGLRHGSCLEKSKELLNPSPALMIRPPTTVSPVSEVQKLAREKGYVRSQSPNLKNFFHEKKLEEEVGSPKLPEFINSIFDLKTRGRLSPFRRSKGALNYRIENLQPFECPQANRLDLHRKSVAKFDCEVDSGEGNSVSGRAEIDRTSCADSLNISEIASSSLNFFDLKKVKFTSGRIENRTVIEEKKKTPAVVSYSQQANPESPIVGGSILPELLSSMINELHEPESKSLECSKSRNGYKVKPGEVPDKIDCNSISVLHRPPPIPKSPRESWLARTLPSISSESRSNFGSQTRSKKQNLKAQSTETPKWETIVKTSNRHHDHVRYSEVINTSHSNQNISSSKIISSLQELVARIHQHTKS